MRVAIIPARGGSKRITEKNIRLFNGKPIIAYSIDCALSSGLFDRVIVSTNCPKITSVAVEFGAEVPFVRPENLSDDHTGITEVVAHGVDWLLEQGCQLTAVCCLFATAPLVSKDDLKKGLELFEAEDWNYVFSATEFESPIFRSFQVNENREIEMFFPDNFGVRSQDLPKAFYDAAQFYWGTPKAWQESAVIFDNESTIVHVPKWRVCDIDESDDWQRAELIHNAIYNLTINK